MLSRGTPRRVLLYRKSDLDALVQDPAIDWEQVRATGPYRPSPLAHLRPAKPRLCAESRDHRR